MFYIVHTAQKLLKLQRTKALTGQRTPNKWQCPNLKSELMADGTLFVQTSSIL
jgi:hypothetical protein